MEASPRQLTLRGIPRIFLSEEFGLLIFFANFVTANKPKSS
jgi:hypothetical protein